MRNRTFAAIALGSLAALCLWAFWPAVVAWTMGMGLPGTVSCERVDILAKIGDSYGSLNSFATILAASAATFALATQHRQIRQLEDHQEHMNAMQFVSLYHSLEPDAHSRQRVAVLKTLARAAQRLTGPNRTLIFEAVVPTAQEIAIMKEEGVPIAHQWEGTRP